MVAGVSDILLLDSSILQSSPFNGHCLQDNLAVILHLSSRLFKILPVVRDLTFSGLDKEVITKGVFSPEESLESLEYQNVGGQNREDLAVSHLP